MPRTTLRLRYLTLKRRALCWVLRRLCAGRPVCGAPRAVWPQLRPESVESNLASALLRADRGSKFNAD